MKPGFFEGVLVALIASVFAVVFHTVCAPLVGSASALRIIIGTLALGYVAYLLKRSPRRQGRLAAMTMWALATVIAAWAIDSLLLYAAAHLLLIWLLRSFNFYTSLLAASVDLGLSLLSLLVAVWASMTSGHLGTAVWCAFLVQAMFVFIPRSGWRWAMPIAKSPTDRFQHAFRAAEAAVAKLSAPR